MHWTVSGTFEEQLLCPYHIRRVPCLSANDFQPRVVFCDWLFLQCAQNPDFATHFLVTNEVCSISSGITNFTTFTHGLWKTFTYPIAKFQHMFSIYVWTGIIGDFLIGLFVLPPRLTGRRFLRDDSCRSRLDHFPDRRMQDGLSCVLFFHSIFTFIMKSLLFFYHPSLLFTATPCMLTAYHIISIFIHLIPNPFFSYHLYLSFHLQS